MINKFYIKKWFYMITGRSILHVNQEKGKIYSKYSVKGYYNDLTEKVTKSNLSVDELPKTKLEDGREIEFATAIFQYGLGAYDLYLLYKEEDSYKRFIDAVNWAEKMQMENGGWKSFEYMNKEHPYSSMTQGEGASLLLRAYQETKDEKYIKMAQKAIELLITPENNGGTAIYENEDVYFQEFYGKATVLNGWIFSLWGIYDYLKINNNERIRKIYVNSLSTLEKNIEKYDTGYWSKYDIQNKIASPFYHNLHIHQLEVLYDITHIEAFNSYMKKFEKYQENNFYKTRAFIKKAIQKIME